MAFFLVFPHTDVMLKSSLVPTSHDLSCLLIVTLCCVRCLILTPSPYLLQEFMTGQGPDRCVPLLLVSFLSSAWVSRPFGSDTTYSCRWVGKLACFVTSWVSVKVGPFSAKSVTVVKQLSSWQPVPSGNVLIRAVCAASELEAWTNAFAVLLSFVLHFPVTDKEHSYCHRCPTLQLPLLLLGVCPSWRKADSVSYEPGSNIRALGGVGKALPLQGTVFTFCYSGQRPENLCRAQKHQWFCSFSAKSTP